MKLKKFVVGLVASALVVASMATTAFAASPSTDTVVTTDDTSSSSGSSSSSSSSKSNAAVFASNFDVEVIKLDGVDIEPYGANVAQLSDSTIADAKAQGTGGILKAGDITDPRNSAYNNSITLRIKSSAFKAGMKITVLHYKDGAWEKITPDSVSDGEIIVTLTSLSPVVVTAEGVSDKTGESVPVLPIAAAICLAGVVFFSTKFRFAK